MSEQLHKARMEAYDPETGAKIGEVDVLTSPEAVVFSDGQNLSEVLASGVLKGEKGDPGEAGERGLDGTPGVNGKSAYELAQDNGFVGSEVEYLASLKGEKGDSWTIVKTYPTIIAMEADHANEEVKEGQLVAISSNENDPDNARVYMKNATDYSFVLDMSGATGVQGPAGADGKDGKDGIDGDTLMMGTTPENAQPVRMFLRIVETI